MPRLPADRGKDTLTGNHFCETNINIPLFAPQTSALLSISHSLVNHRAPNTNREKSTFSRRQSWLQPTTPSRHIPTCLFTSTPRRNRSQFSPQTRRSKMPSSTSISSITLSNLWKLQTTFHHLLYQSSRNDRAKFRSCENQLWHPPAKDSIKMQSVSSVSVSIWQPHDQVGNLWDWQEKSWL